METKKKIFISVLSVMAIVLGIIGFFVFFYPDEKLQDTSDLAPTIQNVPQADNAYYFIEDAKKNYQQPAQNAADMISFLEGKTSAGTQNINEEYISQFLASEETTIKSLELAEQLPAYENPKAALYETLDLINILPSTNPSTMNVIRILYVKGLNELKENQASQGLQTIRDAMKLAAKIRRGSLSVIEYLINHTIILQGKGILNYFADNAATTATEVETFVETLVDTNRQDYINALKFEFQSKKNPLTSKTTFDALRGDSIFVPTNNYQYYLYLQNSFNLRKNVTINILAKQNRNLINAVKNDINCDQPVNLQPDTQFCDSTITPNSNGLSCLFQENGIGKDYLGAVTPDTAFIIHPKIFCDTTQKL